jgi:hypothetical protein
MDEGIVFVIGLGLGFVIGALIFYVEGQKAIATAEAAGQAVAQDVKKVETNISSAAKDLTKK